jgi:hypothetical protein
MADAKAAAAPGTTQCPYCLEQVISGALKCKHCGSTLRAAGPTHGGTCPFCREQIDPEALKCKHCGSTLSAAPQGADDAGCGCEHQKGFDSNYATRWPTHRGGASSGDPRLAGANSPRGRMASFGSGRRAPGPGAVFASRGRGSGPGTGLGSGGVGIIDCAIECDWCTYCIPWTDICWEEPCDCRLSDCRIGF